jgi:hypothetical protein
MLLDPGGQFRIFLKYLVDTGGRCDDDQIGLLNLLDAAMGLDIQIAGASDRLPIRRCDADVKKRRGEAMAWFKMSMGPAMVVAIELWSPIVVTFFMERPFRQAIYR